MRVHVKAHNLPAQELTLDTVNLMLARGELDGSELAWVPGMSEWTALDLVPGVVRPQPPTLPETVSTPPPPPRATVAATASEPTTPGKVEFLPDRFDQVPTSGWRAFCLAAHPQAWRRFWARLIDVGMARICLEVAALLLLLTTGFWPPYQTLPIVGFVGTFVVWVIFLLVYEAFMLSVFGTTVGKLIFRIRVLRRDGSCLSFAEAFWRANHAIGSGMFYLIVFPGLTFWAFYRAYKQLVLRGCAPWDSDTEYVVRCRPVFAPVYAFGVILAISAILGYAVISEYSKQEFGRSIQRRINR
jgi:uncharacterized RDD family membrane protein YckC